jgi:hypothetical protein
MPLLTHAKNPAMKGVLSSCLNAFTKPLSISLLRSNSGSPRAMRALTFVASLAVVSALALAPVSSATAAPASAVAQLSRTVTVPVAPATSFKGASSGDGWDVQFYGNRIFNVFHHNGRYQIDCHLQVDGTRCDSGNGPSLWPKVLTDAAGSTFHSPAHASGSIDQATGRFYGWTTRASDETGGIMCVDLTSTTADAYCGFTALTGKGEAPEPDGYSAVDGNATVGSQMFALNAGNAGGSGNHLLCFDTSTGAACPSQPFALANYSGVYTTDQDWTTAVAGKVFILGGSTLSCFDPSTSAACVGWNSPKYVTNGWNTSQPFAAVDSAGSPAGICAAVAGTFPCWNLDGTAKATPAALARLVGYSYSWQSNRTFGSRVYLADGWNTIQCFDFATSLGCPKFPITISQSALIYTVNPDPQRFGCMWTNADSGAQIQNFDAFTGGPCGTVTRVSSAVVIPTSACAANSWNSATVTSPARSTYASASVTVENAQGVAESPAIPIDSDGKFDLAGLNLGSSPVFGFSFTDATSRASSVQFDFAWQSASLATCAVPAAPVPATATAAAGGLTVAWTAPSYDGGSPLTSYTATATSPVSTTTSSCTAVAPATSCVITGLVGGTTYGVGVTASNQYATGPAATTSGIPSHAALATIRVSPSTVTVTSGDSARFTAEGFDAAGNDLGDVTSQTTFTVADPSATVTGASVKFVTAPSTTVTATDGNAKSTALVTIEAAPLVSLEMTPGTTRVTSESSQAFTITGADKFGKSLGDQTSAVNLTTDDSTDQIVGNVITFNTGGIHTVTATEKGVTVKSTVTVVYTAVQLATHMGRASDFGVLAGAATTIPASMVYGDIGAAAALTVTDTLVDGAQHESADDETTGALTDLATAYAALKALVPTGTLTGDDLGGMTILPGVYHRDAALAVTSTLTFDAQGDPNARFIIQSDAAMNTTAATVMILKGGAKASNIFWVTTGAATLGASSTFEGTIVSGAAITLGAGTDLDGDAFSLNAAVTLDANTVGLDD